MRKIVTLFFGIILGIVGLWWFATYSRRATTEDVLIVGTASGYAPYVSVNQAGDYEGFDIDVAQALAQQLGKKLVLQDLGSMAPLFMALEQESIDVIIWGLSITQERLKKVIMVKYAGDTVDAADPLLFWGAIPQQIKSLADMRGKKVCVEPGSSQESVLLEYPDITAVPTERVDDALLMLQYGKADAALLEPTIAAKFQKKYTQLNSIMIPLPAEKQVHGVGIVIKQSNKKLAVQIEQAVTVLRASGFLETKAQRWGIS